jgi:hypothetical protein
VRHPAFRDVVASDAFRMSRQRAFRDAAGIQAFRDARPAGVQGFVLASDVFDPWRRPDPSQSFARRRVLMRRAGLASPAGVVPW